MSNKKLETYNKIFSTIFDILKIENIKYEPKSIKIMCDFELNFRKSIKFNFTGADLKGCYFHYVKNLWKKAKKLGLCSMQKNIY